MRIYLLGLLFVIVAGCSTALAQHSVFVVQDDRNEPCRRFKMRVLIPADNSKLDLSQRKPSDSIDQKMIWNPCGDNNLQIASTPSKPGEKPFNNYVVVPVDVLEQKLKRLRPHFQIIPEPPPKTGKERP